jgi:hypothetical protein
LAADSAGIKKIQQDKFFLGYGPGQPGLQIIFPFNFMMHGLPPQKSRSAAKFFHRLCRLSFLPGKRVKQFSC